MALLALLGQVVLPHLHAVQSAPHATSGDSREHRAVGLPHERPVAIGHEAPPAGRAHAESRCPVCQALAHTHDFLPTSARQPARHDERIASASPPCPDHTGERVTAHAPRSPPLAV